jgi:hypothetical protein
MTISLSNSRKPTNEKVWIKCIKSRKARKQVLVLSLSQDTRGNVPFPIYIYMVYTLLTKFFSSLVTTLRVAEKFEKSHLLSPQVAPLVENAKFFYMEGYFLTHGAESALHLSSISAAAGKVNFVFHRARISD